MSSAEESPAQKAARLRRERREAKIKDGGTARLDKITSMSGRTPVSAREESSPSPQPPSQTQQPSPPAPTDDPPIQPPSLENQSPETMQAQQEYLRALLRQSGTPQPQQDAEDPTMKLLSSLLGGAPPGEQGSPSTLGGRGGGTPGPGPGLSQADLASSLGVPPFLTKLLGAAGSQPQSEAEKSQLRRWKFLHVIFAITVAFYLLSLIGSSITTYGARQPPPPPTVQNPFMLFVTGELLLSGGRVMMRREGGIGLGMLVSVLRDVVRDGSVVLFLLGMGTWWHGGWMAST